MKTIGANRAPKPRPESLQDRIRRYLETLRGTPTPSPVPIPVRSDDCIRQLWVHPHLPPGDRSRCGRPD
jgi:hypothetical protein